MPGPLCYAWRINFRGSGDTLYYRPDGGVQLLINLGSTIRVSADGGSAEYIGTV
jgi:hypothetical protein